MTGPQAASVARNVAHLRGKQRISLTEMAHRMSAAGSPIARLGLSELERGRRRITVDDLAALAQALGVLDPWDLTRELCATCDSAPPVGLRCATCGREKGDDRG